VTAAAAPEWCGQCQKSTRQLSTPDGPKRCPACHPLAAKTLPQYRHCPRCLLLIHVWDHEPCGAHQPIRERTGRTP
jgi:hypothetical protein